MVCVSFHHTNRLGCWVFFGQIKGIAIIVFMNIICLSREPFSIDYNVVIVSVAAAIIFHI